MSTLAEHFRSLARTPEWDMEDMNNLYVGEYYDEDIDDDRANMLLAIDQGYDAWVPCRIYRTPDDHRRYGVLWRRMR